MKVYLLAIVVSALVLAAPSDSANVRKKRQAPGAAIATAITSLVSGILNSAIPAGPAKAIAKLIGDIGTLVSDAIAANYPKFGTDVDNIVCDSLAIGGITTCNLDLVSVSISTLVTDCQKKAPPTTIVTDAFNVAIAAVKDAAIMSSGKMPSALTTAIVNLLNAINKVVTDAITCGAAFQSNPAWAWLNAACMAEPTDITNVVTAGIAIGTAAKTGR
jgi:hypothetical protein